MLLSPARIASLLQWQHPSRTESMSILLHMTDLMAREIEYESWKVGVLW